MAKIEMDIAKNVKMIDSLQCELLHFVSELFSSMQDGKMSTKERADLLANMEIIIYLLAERLGISNQSLDQRVLSRLKLGLLEENAQEEWKTSLLTLFRHIDKTRGTESF